MKYANLIVVSLCVILLAGCTGIDYSFRVTDTFGPEKGIAPGEGTLPGVLPAEGDIPGTPAGDKYETLGVVTASGGEIIVQGNQSDNRIRLIGRDLASGESPRGMIIKFDSACVQSPGTGFCLQGASSPVVVFRVRNKQGNIGLTFTISGGSVSIAEGGSIHEFEQPAGGAVDFYGGTAHTVTIQMNFETRKGSLTVTQGLSKTLDFELPNQFGIAQSLEALSQGSSGFPGQGHRLITPVANFVFVE